MEKTTKTFVPSAKHKTVAKLFMSEYEATVKKGGNNADLQNGFMNCKKFTKDFIQNNKELKAVGVESTNSWLSTITMLSQKGFFAKTESGQVNGRTGYKPTEKTSILLK